MIKSFADAETQALWETGASRRKPPPTLRGVALRKLLMIDSATKLGDLRIPPGNRLEELKGNRKGQNSIRINDQYRICFVWKDGNAYRVEIADYH
ncbi:MAG: type II toxin-antitoxin system RelE/ParE family toxin [Acidobacteria bacterium]|nr:type II toxin-antitoxin system RelE/ParE family toxin [Acidobacteriota bacterium]